MHIIDTVEYEAHGHTYQIISLWTGTEWKIKIRDEQMSQIGPVFSVTLETGQDYELYNGSPALEALVDIVKRELDSGRVKSDASTDEG